MIAYMAMIEDPKEHSKFEEIYIKYRDFMLTVADSILHNTDDNEDAVHDAFVSVIKNLSKIQEIDSSKTRGFLAVITRRKAINIYNKRIGTIENEDHIEDRNQLGDIATLEQAICKLPTRYRDFILLKYYHGFSTKECAKLFGITPVTASKLDQRAKQKFLEICKQESIL